MSFFSGFRYPFEARHGKETTGCFRPPCFFTLFFLSLFTGFPAGAKSPGPPVPVFPCLCFGGFLAFLLTVHQCKGLRSGVMGVFLGYHKTKVSHTVVGRTPTLPQKVREVVFPCSENLRTPGSCGVNGKLPLQTSSPNHRESRASASHILLVHIWRSSPIEPLLGSERGVFCSGIGCTPKNEGEPFRRL